MSRTQNSIASLLEQFTRLQNNALAIVSKVSDLTTTNAETVSITILNDAGVEETFVAPSFGKIKSDIARLDQNIQQLAGLGESSSLVRMPDGTTRRIYEASILRDPKPVTSLQVPSTFTIKSNWFFESFLNPLLNIDLDVSGQVPDDMERAGVKRVILNADTDEKKQYFDETYKGRQDVQHDAFLIDLDASGIDYFVDEEVVDLPVAIVRFTGSFDVTRLSDEPTTVSVGDRSSITEIRRKYFLNKFTYTDVVSGLADTRTVKNGDRFVTADGSKYLVTSANPSEMSVVLKMESGSQPITIGAGTLSIYSETFKNKIVQVGVGHDERQVVFIKPIVPKFNVAASTWSPGIAFLSNELTISTTTGVQTLDDFYKTQVVDFGKVLMNAAMDKMVPSALGEKPDAPTLNAANFQVVAINRHKTSDKQREEINQKLASKVSLENEINQLNKAIDSKKKDLNASASRSEPERRQLRTDLDALARQKSSTVTLYNSVVKELATKAQSDPTISEPLKFRVRGFFPMPAAKISDATGPQEPVQFVTEYRYAAKDGTSQQAAELGFTDTDGKEKTGAFSNWVAVESPLRRKVYNEATGFYEWDLDDVQDADAVNINQVDIPISKGEKVQFRIKTLSEAGWPVNPVESDWSEIITVDFPENLSLVDSTAAALSEAQQEETKVKFQEELDARYLDLHLLTSFTNGDSYYAHDTSAIASGFYDATGNVINLYQKILSITNELIAIRELIQKAKGTLVTYLIDSAGNVTKLTNNSTTQLFAGYYKDLIKSGSGLSVTYDHGQVITATYTLRFENSAATALELASYLPGGAGVMAPQSATSTNNDYKNNRRYDLAPVSLTGISGPQPNTLYNEAPFQSAQVQGQWMYSRFKTVGLDQDLFSLTVPAGANTTVAQGVPTAPAGTTPVNGCYLLPTDPTLTVGTQDVLVWNGQALNAGNGYLSEFCLHKDHPIAATIYSATSFVPQIAGGGPMVYPGAAHSDFFWMDVTLPDGTKQLEYVQALPYSGGATTLQHYPGKLGFSKNDELTIGKYTCGAYCFFAPTDYEQIRVEGTTELAKKLLEFGEEKGINIPFVFQFRCSDKLGYIGGYRQSGTISNITYTKKLGVDVQVKGEAPFSFDIEVSTKYEQDSLVQPTYIPNNALQSLRSIRDNQR